jgi:cyclomaltodextrinase
VAYDVGHPFWKDWRKWVRSINPEAYMTAELVDPIGQQNLTCRAMSSTPR